MFATPVGKGLVTRQTSQSTKEHTQVRSYIFVTPVERDLVKNQD